MNDGRLVLDEENSVVYIEQALQKKGRTMTLLYEQFLGSAPGSCVELVDNSKSPYRVRTPDGFEFLISSEDFLRFYRQIGGRVPDMWRPFVTDQEKGLVDSIKMAKVLKAIQPFEKIFQDFSKARNFLRDAVFRVRAQGRIEDHDLQKLMEKHTRSKINFDDIKRELDKLSTLNYEIMELLADEAFLNFYTPVGHIQKLSVRPVETSRMDAAAEAISKSAQATKPIRGRGNAKNVDMKVEGNLLTITVDLSKDYGPSKSGKTVIIATTEGNKTVPGRDQKIGLNVFKYIDNRCQCGDRKSFKNVELEVTESVLTITVDLSKEFGPSKSGKTIIVASTQGNQLVYGRNELIGLNVYRKIEA